MKTQYKQYWSRMPGRFVNKLTGKDVPDCHFTGRVVEWYECFWESIIDIVNTLGIPKNEVIVKAPSDATTILLTSCLIKVPLKTKNKNFLATYFDMKLYRDNRIPRNKIKIYNKDKTKCGELEILDMSII